MQENQQNHKIEYPSGSSIEGYPPEPDQEPMMKEPMTAEQIQEVIELQLRENSPDRNARYMAEAREVQRPARYNKPDRIGAPRQTGLFGSRKSSKAMLNGTQCWTCPRRLDVATPNKDGWNPKQRGPRYCWECLQKKRKSARRLAKRVNKLAIRKPKPCPSPNAKPARPYWV